MNIDRESDPLMRLFIVHHKGLFPCYAVIQATSAEEALYLAREFDVNLYEDDVQELICSAEPRVLWHYEES